MGSANCTVADLGVPEKASLNHECLLFRKLPRGSAQKLLHLSFKAKISITDIANPPEKSEPAEGTGTFRAGSVERRTSHPIIIANPQQLMRFAPFTIADSIRRKLNAVLSGEADLIGLARDIHLLLEDDSKVSPPLEKVYAAGPRSAALNIVGRDYATPEEFRKALNLRASLQSAGLPHGENPALQALLQIVLRGMIHVESVDKADADETASAKRLDLGEDQDDSGLSDDDEAPSVPSQSEANQPEAVSQSECQRNRTALWHGIERFQEFLTKAKASGTELDLNVVTRSLFMLYLMLQGCTKEYQVEDGEAEVLIPFAAEPGDDFRDSFLFVAAHAIAAIWGPDLARSLMARLSFNAESDALPIQITTLTIISGWVLAAILTEVRKAKEHKSLRDILEKQVPSRFAATTVFPELGQEEILAIIGQMEMNTGMDATMACRIKETLRGQDNPTQ